MPSLERSTFIAAPISDVFAFFTVAQNLARITPPALGLQIIDAPARRLRGGDRIRYRIRIGGIPLTWVTVLSDWEEGRRFVDVQERGPYRRWRHEHTLQPAEGGVIMLDRVEYELPLGRIGEFFAGWFVGRQLNAIFEYRTKVMHELFG